MLWGTRNFRLKGKNTCSRGCCYLCPELNLFVVGLVMLVLGGAHVLDSFQGCQFSPKDAGASSVPVDFCELLRPWCNAQVANRSAWGNLRHF